MKTGDIILIPFPYAEHTHVKVRPAVFITTTKDKFSDVVASAISSVIPKSISENEIIIEPNRSNKLRVKSVIKVDRIVTLKKQDKIADLGNLTETELKIFKRKFCALVA